MIKATVPKEKLLVYKLGSGWQPLCEFLGKDVPKVGFPRVNETEELKERVFLALMLGVRRAVIRWMKVLMWGLPLLWRLSGIFGVDGCLMLQNLGSACWCICARLWG